MRSVIGGSIVGPRRVASTIPALAARTEKVFDMTAVTLDSKTVLTQERLKEVLHYDPETGQFIWLVARAQKPKGSIAGAIKKGPASSSQRRWGYVLIGIARKVYFAHRLAWFYVYGRWPVQQLDHIDGDRTNNRIANLRESTSAQNAQNRYYSGGKSSRFLGVCWAKDTQRWQTMIRINGKPIYLGQYRTEAEAYEVYLAAKAKYHPFSMLAKLS